MLPAAPPRFSTTTGWPHFSPIFCASTRPRISVVPPGAQGTIMRTGFAGYDCPAACWGGKDRRTNAVIRSRRRMGMRIMAAAARLYGEHGFEIPLARIAREARVSEAVLRRRGGEKLLREQVLARLFAGRWEAEWDRLLVDRTLPLGERLARFYVEYRGKIER